MDSDVNFVSLLFWAKICSGQSSAKLPFWAQGFLHFKQRKSYDLQTNIKLRNVMCCQKENTYHSGLSGKVGVG